MSEKKVPVETDIWVHFPPVPLAEPRAWRAIGPPRTPRITDAQVEHLAVGTLAQMIIDANDSCAIFGFHDSDSFTSTDLAKRYRELSRRLHGDKTRNEKAKSAFLYVQEAHTSLNLLLASRNENKK
jgi:hypothetical protein